MDLYQIFITHNPAWTPKEIVVFSILFIIVAVLSGILVHRQRIVFSQAVAGLLLWLFLGIVFGSTVFTRTPKSYHDYELELFWSWRAVFKGSRGMLKENLLNMALLFPAGILLPAVCRKKIRWCKGLIAGVFISAVIETSQLVFCRGLFEWDDMIHNGIGCMIGCIIGSCFVRKRRMK